MPLSMEGVQMNSRTCLPMWSHHYMVRFLLRASCNRVDKPDNPPEFAFNNGTIQQSDRQAFLVTTYTLARVAAPFRCRSHVIYLYTTSYPVPYPHNPAPQTRMNSALRPTHSNGKTHPNVLVALATCTRFDLGFAVHGVDWSSTRGSFSHRNPVSLTVSPCQRTRRSK